MSDFSLDKKTVVFITVCCLVVGGLLFFAGMIVGLDRGSHETQARMEKEFAARLAANAAAPQEQEVAQSQPDDSANPPSEPLDPAPPDSSDSPSQPQLRPVADTGRSYNAARTLNVAASTAENATSDADEPGADEEADAESESANDYSLQIGAFRSQDNAARLRDELKARGYAVFLLRMVDERGNEWHMVRQGHYRDRSEALNEAAIFSGETQMAAVVRPANQ